MAISILLIDDDDQFRTMLSEALTGEGYQVSEASDGLQGIKLYENQPTDIVITDLVMPEKEGLEMIVEIEKLYSDVKIIAISGGGRGGSQDYLKMAKAFGAQRVLAKPFSHREILEAIRQMLDHE
jgi:DNA-binding response OmpR family regulator